MKKSVLILIIAMLALSLSACDTLRYFALTDPTKNPIEVTAEAEKTQTAAEQTAIMPPVLDEGDMTDPNFTEPTAVDPSTIDLSTMDGKIGYTNARIKQFLADNKLSDLDYYVFSNDGETLNYQIFLREESALKMKLEQFVQDYKANGSLSDPDKAELENLMALFNGFYTEIKEATGSTGLFQLMRYDGFIYLEINDGVASYCAFQ